MKLNETHLNEFQLIEWIKGQSRPEVLPNVGIGDDGAVIKHDGLVILASDTVLEGTHFTKETPLNLVGRKALATCISDIAAMGATPVAALVNLILPKRIATAQVQEIMLSILELAKEYDLIICGGDITSWDGPLGISISITGTAIKDPILRSGAKSGDTVFVSGPLGGSFKSNHHLIFEPRTKLIIEILEAIIPTAMIDISDGLIQDLKHILKASSVGCRIHENLIPLRDNASLEQAFCDGEDFELCICISKRDLVKVDPKWQLIKIGHITEGSEIIFDSVETEKISRNNLAGYNHL